MQNRRLIVIHLVHTLYGGVASVAAELMNEQYKDGIIPIVVYACDDTALEEMLIFKIEKIKVEMKSLPGYSMLWGMGIRKIYKKIQNRYPDYKIIVHAHNVQTIGLFSYIRNIPIICTLHSLGGNEKKIRAGLSDMIYRGILRKLIKNNGKIVSVSYAIADYYGGKKKKIVNVIHNGVECNSERIEHDKFVVAHVGNISRAKGWDIVCDGFSMIPKSVREKMEFISVGRATSYSEQDIEKIFAEKGISDQAKYLGFVNDAVNKIMPGIDLLVLASRNEGLGLVLIEAIAKGIPVLGANTGGICEVLKDGYNGFVISNAEDVCERIGELFMNQELYSKVSYNARETYLKEYTAEEMYRKYCDVYRKLNI